MRHFGDTWKRNRVELSEEFTMSRRVFHKGDNSPPLETNSLPRSIYMRSNTYGASGMEHKRAQKKSVGTFSHRRQYSDETLWMPSRLWNMWPNSSHGKSNLSAKSLPHLIPKQGRSGKKKDTFHVPHRRMTDRSIVFSKDDILHKGWLKKQGGPFRIWQRRYFILVGDFMFYFAKEEDQRPLGFIPLRGNKVEKHPFNPDEPGKYLFEVKPGTAEQGPLTNHHETFLLWAGSSHDLDEWLQVIRRVMYGRRGGGIFGQSLSDTITHESTTSTRKIPLIVEQCVSYLREHGMQEEGIFRLPGRSTLVKELQERFDLGEKPDLEVIQPDIHTVASLFKLYLRQLPEPVIPFDHYDNFYDAINLLKKSEEEGKARLIRELALLPRPNHFLLKYLCKFLHDLQTYEKDNRMTIMNLSTVFGPNIYRAQSEDPNTMMETTTMSQKFMNLVIANHTEMFPSNDSIDFSDFSESRPVPPPRSRGHKQGKSNVTNIDLLKYIHTNNLRAEEPISSEDKDSEEKDPKDQKEDPWQQQLMRFSSAEDLEELEKMVNATFCRRSMATESSTIATEKKNDVNSLDTGSLSSISTENSESSLPKITESSDKHLRRSGSEDQRETLSFVNPMVGMRQSQGDNVTRNVVPPPMGIDLTEGTPEHKRLSNHEDNAGIILLEEQLKALKTEIATQKKEYEAKIQKWKIKCEGLQIKLGNEVKAHQAADERNKQLLMQLNSFIEEYGPSD